MHFLARMKVSKRPMLLEFAEKGIGQNMARTAPLLMLATLGDDIFTAEAAVEMLRTHMPIDRAGVRH
jgi:hypothetical protein